MEIAKHNELSVLSKEILELEVEAFEITDYADQHEYLADSTCSSTTSSTCSSGSGGGGQPPKETI